MSFYLNNGVPESELPEKVAAPSDLVRIVDGDGKSYTCSARNLPPSDQVLADIDYRIEIKAMRNRGLRSILDNAVPISTLPRKILVRRLRTDYTEFAVYVPIDPSGVRYARHLFTERLNAGNAGATRCFLVTRADLAESQSLTAPPANDSTGTEAVPPGVTIGTAGGTFTGAWTTSASVGGVPDIRYSTAAGDKAVFSLTTVSRIALRTYSNTANGGIVEYVIKDGTGTPVSGSYYTQQYNGTRGVIDLASPTGLKHIQLAQSLPSGNYTVEFFVSAANPSGGRAYIGGVYGYNGPSVTAAGRWSIWSDGSSSGVNYKMGIYPGSRVIYPFTGTSVFWRHVVTSNAGVCRALVYDASGTQVPADKYKISSNRINCYSPDLAQVTTQIVADLPHGNYYLVVDSLREKDPASSGFRIYDVGATSIDESTPGVLGVTPFFEYGTASNYASSSSIGDGAMISGTGNMEYAIRVRSPSSPDSDKEFTGGTHGYETPMANLSIAIDGDQSKYSSGGVGSQWVCEQIKISYDTYLTFPVVGGNWASIHADLMVSRAGYTATITREVVSPAHVYEDYTLMLQGPKTTNPSSPYFAKCVPGGAFVNWAVDGAGNYTLPPEEGSQEQNIDTYNIGAVMYNDRYAMYGYNSSIESVRGNYYRSDVDNVGTLSFVQNRADGLGKYYNMAFPREPGGRLLPVGDKITRSNTYRVFDLPGVNQLMAP